MDLWRCWNLCRTIDVWTGMTHTQINHFTQVAAFDRGYHLMCLCLDSFHNPRDNKTLDTDDGREWKMFHVFLLVHDLMFLHVFFCFFFLTSKCTGRIGCWINLSGGKKKTLSSSNIVFNWSVALDIQSLKPIPTQLEWSFSGHSPTDPRILRLLQWLS